MKYTYNYGRLSEKQHALALLSMIKNAETDSSRRFMVDLILQDYEEEIKNLKEFVEKYEK